MKLNETDPSFQAIIGRLAAVAGQTTDYVYSLWLEYERECQTAGQSAVLPEFIQWYKTPLGGNKEQLEAALVDHMEADEPQGSPNQAAAQVAATEAEPEKPKKWTADAANPPGPIQVNKFNKVHGKFRMEHNTRREKWGVIGGDEHESCICSIFGVGNRPDVTAAQVEIGQRFNWTVSRANVGEVTAAMEAALVVLAANRPVDDKRKTPEAAAQQDREIAEAQAEREAEAAKKAAAMPAPLPGNYQSGTIRRDLVRRMIEAGELVMIDSYHFDDSTGSERGIDKPLPVAIAPADWHDRKEGVAYVHASDFDSGSGRASQGSNGDITLYVHSNCNYTFRRVAKPAVESQPNAGGALGTVARNLEHDGVEIRFPNKPSNGVLDALKREGFRWSRFSKVWYKKHSAAAWKAACDIAGVNAESLASTQSPVETDLAGAYVQAQENAFCDAQAAACGA